MASNQTPRGGMNNARQPVEHIPGDIPDDLLPEPQASEEQETGERTVSLMEIVAISPEEACQHYGAVKINTFSNVMSKINRRLIRAVADGDNIRIHRLRVEPDPDVDTLCLMNDSSWEEVLGYYRSKGWTVVVEGETPGSTPSNPNEIYYVFQPNA